MASTKLTDYERERLENIRRNCEMMASLKIHSIATEISQSSKPIRESKKLSQNKKPGPETAPVVSRRSLRAQGRPPEPNPSPEPRKFGPLSMSEAYKGEGSDRSLIENIKRIAMESDCKDDNSSPSVKEEGNKFGGKTENSSVLVRKEERETEGLEFCGDRVSKVENSSGSVVEKGSEVGGYCDVYSMSLSPKNTFRIFSGAKSLRFFPCASSRMIVTGNANGDVGFCNLDHEGEGGVYTYRSHYGVVSGISIQPHCLSKVFTSCSNGYIRLMDAEKEVFDSIYASECGVYSLGQRSNDAKCLYFGEGRGVLNIWDERNGKCNAKHDLHTERINTIDFNPGNSDLMATSSSDGSVSIWDLRSIDVDKPKSVRTVEHQRAAHSAYFSPSGKFLATSSLEDSVWILSGPDFETSTRIQRNQGWRDTCLPAIWGWTDDYIFAGIAKRGVDVISPTTKETIYTLESPHFSTLPSRLDVHPYHVGTLAVASSWDKIFVWM